MSAPVWKYLSGINTFSEECIGIELAALSGGTSPASAVWAAANDAVFIPLYLPQMVLIKRLYAVNGAAVSGNIEMGLYSEDGGKLSSNVNAAQAGTSAPQFFNITDLILGPGRYYLACALDNTTGTIFRSNLSVPRLQELGVKKMASAYVLPATATLATATSGNLPYIGAEVNSIL